MEAMNATDNQPKGKKMNNELRQMFASGIRARKALGENNGLICQKIGDYRAWALRALALDGPKGKLL